MSGLKLLVAEDEASLRAALTDLFRSEGSLDLVGVACDADEAIELAARYRPDVALLDVKMPGGGGPRAAREIHLRSPGTRILALSAYGDRGVVLEMVRAGAFGYLVKGATASEILDAIHGAARGEVALSSEVAPELMAELAAHLERQGVEDDLQRQRTQRVLRVLRDHTLDVVFQPVVNLTSGVIVGMEALSRFRVEPQRPPDVWFAEAAALGLGPDLELAAVAIALGRLPELLGPCWLSVNVSPETVAGPRFEEDLAGIPADRVVVELTEHARVDDYESLNGHLEHLRGMGVRVAVDDAGAGFASLRHILNLRPDFIKLDTTLTGGIDVDRPRHALARALIVFSAEIDCTLIAEGVETRAEVEALLGLGVRYGQGYHLGRPADLTATLLPLEPAPGGTA